MLNPGLAFAVLPILLLLPGYLLLQNLRGREPLPLPLAEFIFQSVLTSTLLTSALAFPLAEIGLFSLPLVLGGLLLLCAVLSLILWRRRIRLTLPRPRWRDLIPLLLALLAGLLAFHPHEYILGSGDPGSYVNIGVTIAKSGGIVLYNPELKALDPELARSELLFADIPMPHMPAAYHHLPAFFISDCENGQMIPQFYHLFPVWIALGYKLFGLYGALYVAPSFAVLAILAAYFLGKRILGLWAGLLGTLLLMANMIQMWFSRYSSSEILSQCFLLSAVYLLLRSQLPAEQVPGKGLWSAGQGALAAAALGAFLHTRVDALIALVPIAIWGLYLVVFRRDRWRTARPFFLALAVVLVHQLVYVLTIPLRYTLGSLFGLFYYLLRPAMAAALAATGIGGVLLVAVLIRRGWPKRHERFVRWALMAVLAGLFLLAYFIWPAIAPPTTVSYYAWPEPVTMTFENDLNLVRLGWYMTPWALLLSVLGLLGMVRREPAQRIAYMLALFLLYGIIYIYHSADAPVHIHAMRRYVPIVIPVLTMASAYAIRRVGQIFRSTAGFSLATALGIGLLVLTALPTWPLLGHRDYAGAVEHVTALAERFDEHALLLYADVDYGTLLGMPLQYIFDRPGFVLQRVQPDPTTLSAQLERWEDQGKEVFLIVANGRSRLSPASFAFQPQGTVRFTLPRLENTLDRRPARVGEMPFLLEIYRLRPRKGIATSEERFVDVGTADYPFIGEGFWGKETTPDGLTFRWAGEHAELLLPGDWFSSHGALSLTLALGNTRPPEVPLPEVQIWLGDQPLPGYTVQPGLQPYTVVVPAALARSLAGQEEVQLRLRCNTWQPSSMGMADERALGVLVDWIRLTPGFD